MPSFSTIGAVLPLLAAAVGAVELKVNDEASLKAAISQYANGLMSYYKANASGLSPQEIGYIPKPHYWWESGALWGAMVEYTNIVGDESYVKTIQQGLTANYGPANDFILDYKRDQTVIISLTFTHLKLTPCRAMTIRPSGALRQCRRPSMAFRSRKAPRHPTWK